MNKEEEFEALKLIYLNNPDRRLGVFVRAFELFDFQNHWMVKENLGKLSELEMKADFILALDVVFNEDCTDPIGYFAARFWKELKTNLEMNRGLHRTIKRVLLKQRGSDVDGLNRRDIKYFKAIYGLSEVKYKPTSTMHEQELVMMSSDVRDFMVDRYDEQTYNDCIGHFVYGESFANLAYYDNNGLTRQAIHHKLTKAWKSLKRYLSNAQARRPKR